jgi:hypothetical protein
MKRVGLHLLLMIPAIAIGGVLPPVQTVFIVALENHIWSDFNGSTNAPFVNGTLLPMAAHCEQYYNPPGVHPSLPNYIWLEAGTNFGIYDDNDPAVNHQATTNHLVTLLKAAGISWKAYQEDISGAYVPLTSTNDYTPRHDPFVYFDDVTGTNDPHNAYGIAHIRPYSELARDLRSNTVARYNFITPNLCHDGHNSCYPDYNPVRQSDNWLAAEIPKILNSSAWSNCGALFITWDEGEGGMDGPIGMLLISPLGRGGNYRSTTYYTHSSLVRTLQEIFAVTPLLNGAAKAPALSELFMPLHISSATRLAGGEIELMCACVIAGATNIVQASANFSTWTPISTNVTATGYFTIVDSCATNLSSRFYRVLQLP